MTINHNTELIFTLSQPSPIATSLLRMYSNIVVKSSAPVADSDF